MAFYFETFTTHIRIQIEGGFCMWNKIKKIYNQVFKFALAIFLVIFFLFTILTLVKQSIDGNLDPLNFISIAAIALSFPGIVHTLAEEVNPKPEVKKTYKLSCRCPKCKNLVQMDMKEE